MIDLLIPWLLVIGLLYPMRRLEGWLHQHLFKVGWLVTKDFSTTTILYYSLFLPGVVLHEFTRWLVAGMMNVRAERTIRWPEKQEIGELRLDFVRLAKNTSALKLAIISIAPLLVGMGAVSFIASNVLLLDGVMAAIYGESDDWGAALSRLLATPDLWLWVYIVLAISNTMTPEWKNLRGWRPVLIAFAVVIVALYLVGSGDTILLTLLSGPLANTLNTLALTFGVIIIIDVLATGILGGIESLIERVTGDSATFQNGKLVAMRREEVLRQRQQQQEREQKQQAKKPALPTGAPSIYRLSLPVPPAPGREAAPIIVSTAPPASLPPAVPAAASTAAPPLTSTSALPPAAPPPRPVFNPPPAASASPAPVTPQLTFNPPPTPKPVLPGLLEEEDEEEEALISAPPPAAKSILLSLDDLDDEEEDEEELP